MALTDDSGFGDRLAEAAALLECALAECLDEAPEPGEFYRPPRLLAAMRHAALAGGKRFRPFLLIECARIFGVGTDSCGSSAAALECVHCYSLVHDDLPAMDDDDLRRGAPTVHKAFDEATAILAGDALLTLAFDVLSRPKAHPEPSVRVELVAILARAAGLGGMAGGQMLDLQAEGAALDEGAILRMQAMKTGALFSGACEMGAVLGKASPAARNSLRKFGLALGLVFQVADDLLDIDATAETLGKASGKDSARGKATFVSLIGASGARELLSETVADCDRYLADLDADTRILSAAARFAAERRR